MNGGDNMDTTNLKLLVSSSNKTQKQIASDLNFSQQRFNFYVNGQREPDASALCEIAEYFGVSVDYLVCRSTHAEKSAAKKSRNELNADEASLLQSFRQLNGEGQEKLLDLADDLIQSRKYKNRSTAFVGAEAASA